MGNNLKQHENEVGFELTRDRILSMARDCICVDRNDQYGEPDNSFELIARLWSDYKGDPFTAQDVALMMALLKIARIRTGITMVDNYVDACGYLALAGELELDEESEQITEKMW